MESDKEAFVIVFVVCGGAEVALGYGYFHMS